jgi:hypothetical protein
MSETFAWLGYDITITKGGTQWVGTADDGSRAAPFLFVAPTDDEVKRAIRVFIRDRVPETEMPHKRAVVPQIQRNPSHTGNSL